MPEDSCRVAGLTPCISRRPCYASEQMSDRYRRVTMSAAMPTTDALFAGKDLAVLETYRAILAALGVLGPYREEPKKTSIHLAKASGFAGVHPRKGYLILNIRTDGPIDSPRVVKREQFSR